MRAKTLSTSLVAILALVWTVAWAQESAPQPPAGAPAATQPAEGTPAPATPAVEATPTPAPEPAKDEARPLRVRIDILNGQADVRFAGEDWKAAEVGMVLPEGTVLFTGMDTTCVLSLQDVGVVQVLSFTELTVDRFLVQSNKVTSDIAIRTGEIEVSVEGGVYTASLQVHTPNATASVRGTRWAMSVGGGRTACVGRSGLVSFGDRHGRTRSVGAGDKSSKNAGQTNVSAPSENRKADSTTNIAPQGVTSSEKQAATKIATATTGVLASDTNDSRSNIAQQRTEARAQEDATLSERTRKRRDVPPPIITR